MRNVILSLISVGLFTACSNQSDVIEDNSRILVKVGDKAITEKYVQAYLFNRGVKEPSKEQIDQALDALIKQQALLLQADKQGLQLSTEQRLSIQQLKDQARSQLAMQAYLEENPITEEDIRTEYDQIVTELQGTEYKVRHMLFQDEVQALTYLDKINQGQPYLDVESEYLQDYSQIKNVGDIGWVNVKQVPESFQTPLQQLSAGQVFEDVIVSQYGVHVVFLEDKRASDPPPFDAVKEGIKKSLTIKAQNRYQQIALAKAKVSR